MSYIHVYDHNSQHVYWYIGQISGERLQDQSGPLVLRLLKNQGVFFWVNIFSLSVLNKSISLAR